MNTDYHIHYLKRQEIDTARWDACIAEAPNDLIYGHSHYLDAMAAGQWDALVLDDYQAVMPLTWRTKAGIRYLYQPAFTQQTGIFSREPVNASQIEAFLEAIRCRYRFVEIYLNYANDHPLLEKRNNFILPLDSGYEQLAAGYKKDLRNNLNLATRSTLYYTKDFELKTALRDFRHEYASRLPAIKEEDYRHFETLCLLLQQRGQLLVRAVLNEDRQPLCSAVLLRDKTRLYLLHSTLLTAGRTTRANHFLLDQFIREWAGCPLILDFEGSDQPGISHFYANFGAAVQPYFFYRFNRLLWPWRLLKK